MLEIVLSKVCNKCGLEKSLDDFRSYPKCRDGKRGECKQCVSEYKKERQKSIINGSIKVISGSMEDLREKLKESYIYESNSGCFLWSPSVNTDGYGQLTWNGKNRRANRLSYESCVGPIPEGLQVLHRCDTPSCIRPDHLFLGNNTENRVDSVIKGRVPKGEKNGNSKLTETGVIDILTLKYLCGLSGRKIAKKLGIYKGNVRFILKGETWKHLSHVREEIIAIATGSHMPEKSMTTDQFCRVSYMWFEIIKSEKLLRVSGQSITF